MQENFNKEQKIKLILDFWHRTMIHHGMWFAEVKHQFGRERALEIIQEAYDKSYAIQMKRLAKVFDFELENGIPDTLLKMKEEKIDELKEAVAVNWLANDGVWFQAVEFAKGMNDAKRCNDSCWAQFSPFEAWSIRKLLGLEKHPGLEGLKEALQYSLYATINDQSIEDDSTTSFIFRMNNCRVQSARKRKGMEDYHCKSGGLVEYTSFAEAIDPRIKTECIGCPTDSHPEEWYCSWRFILEDPI